MGRYFDVAIFDTQNKLVERFRSHDDQSRPKDGALMIEISAAVTLHANAGEGTVVTIYGLSRKYLQQQFNLNGFRIEVYGGMAKGLPLANPAQRGLLFVGNVQETTPMLEMGNVILVLSVTANAINPRSKPVNLFFKLKKGEKLENGIKNLFPNEKLNISISDRLIVDYDIDKHFTVFDDFARYVFELSKHIIKDTEYKGVNASHKKDGIIFLDFSKPSKKIIKIDFKDLIGQPTFRDLYTIDARFVMRGDLSLGDTIQFPDKMNVQFGQGTFPLNTRQQATFKGNFTVLDLHHIGNSRASSGDSWVTLVTAGKLK